MKLKDTKAEKSFNYLWLSKRIYPYIKPFLPVIILGLAVGIPLGLTDGVISFSIGHIMYILSFNTCTRFKINDCISLIMIFSFIIIVDFKKL